MPTILEVEQGIRRRGRWLCRAGWALFGVALLLPSFPGWSEWLSGWECFRIVFDILRQLVVREDTGINAGWDYYYAGFAVANSVMVLSPLYLRVFRGRLRHMRAGAIAMGLACLYAASLPFADGKLTTNLHVLHIGYYAWVLSFALVTLGAFNLSAHRSRFESRAKEVRSSRTPEDIAAERELDALLAGTHEVAVVTVAPDRSLRLKEEVTE